jgi:hypothetical protein
MVPETIPNSSVRERWDSPAVERFTGRHSVSVTRWERNGILPKSHRLLGRKFWWRDEVEAAIARLEATQDLRVEMLRTRGAELAALGRATVAARRAQAAKV